MPALDFEISKPISQVFRRAFIKRRLQTTGKYETSFTDVTSFVKKWGSLTHFTDDIRLNRFTHNGINLTMNNDTGKFNHETSNQSLWTGFLTRYRTLIKIEAGYGDSTASELPTDTSLGVFILDDEIEIDAESNEALLHCSSLRSVFHEVRAVDIPGLGTTQTASQIVTRIRDHTDGSGNFIFREFITSTSWSIQATVNNYNFATSTTLEGMSTWDMMEKLAEAENFVVYISRSGTLTFKDRNPNTTSSQFSFLGQGYNRQNIVKIKSYKESLNKLYNYIRLKYLTADTSTSFVTAGTITSVDPSNPSWKYGSRVYEFENTFVTNTTTAQSIASFLFSELGVVKNELEFDALFTPQIDMLDRVNVSYQSIESAANSLWDVAIWDTDLWALESQNFEFTDKPFKVLAVSHDLDSFISNFRLREV